MKYRYRKADLENSKPAYSYARNISRSSHTIHQGRIYYLSRLHI